MREENPKKALFVVHREQIAKQAIKSFKNVFGDTKTFGLISGTSKYYEADYLFSTMQMMAKPEIRERLNYEKVLPNIEYVKDKEMIIPKVAEKIIGKLPATARRYMKILLDAGLFETEGSTSNLVYVIKKRVAVALKPCTAIFSLSG